MRHFLIDTDTASDDAVALVIALRHADVQVKAITVVAGNVPVNQAVQNALYTVEICGSRVPVYKGAAGPLMGRSETAQNVHGSDGMGDIGLPLTGRTPAPGQAVSALIDTVNRFAGTIELVTLGPLTNLALALRQEPGLAEKVKSCTIMGGTGQGYGNVTAVAEYNFWADPEAAAIVFESGLPIRMVGWDVSRQFAVIEPTDAEALRALGTPLAVFCIDIQRMVSAFCATETHLAGFDLPDPIAMSVALDPTVATDVRQLHVAVETQGRYCRGQSVVDHLGITGTPANAHVVLAADRQRFLAMIRRAMA